MLMFLVLFGSLDFVFGCLWGGKAFKQRLLTCEPSRAKCSRPHVERLQDTL